MGDGLPSLSDSSQFPLEALNSKGFTQAVHFPRGVKGRVCKALGIGLLKHFDIHYPLIASFLDKTWRKLKVPELVKVHNKHQGNLEAGVSNESFWADLEAAVKQTIATYEGLPGAKRKALLERGDINLDDREFLRLAAEALMLTIIILQTCENEFKQSTLKPGSQHTGLIVVLVQDKNDLYLMLHEDLKKASGKSGVPFYYREEDEIPIPALLENSFQPDAISPDSQRKEQIISEKITNMTLAFSKFAVTVAAQSPEYHALLLESVLPAIREFDDVSPYAKGTFPFQADLLQLKQLLQAPTDTSSADAHYPHDCYKYYTTEQYAETTCCGRPMHVYCLNQWAIRCYEEAVPDWDCKVPCPMCRFELPESLLELYCPDIYARLQERKRQVCLRASAPVSAVQNYSYDPAIPSSSSLLVSHTCHSCNQSGSISWFYLSKLCICKVCLSCAQGKAQCAGCNRNYSTREQMDIQSSYQQAMLSSS